MKVFRWIVFLGLALAPLGASAKLRVCATTPDLGSLVQALGGDRVDLVVFAKPSEDPHFIDARPAFIRELSQADLFIETGLELEIGWAPVLLQNARNDKVLPGAPGFLDASQAIAPMDIPAGPVDRSMGDVHPLGNPHYLSDPLSGLKVARLIASRLGELDPAGRDFYAGRMQAFHASLMEALVGKALAAKYDGEKLALLYEGGKLGPFLERQHEKALGGWLGHMLPYDGSKGVADHNLWPYFSRTFGLRVIGFLEPKPGVPPTTRHLEELVAGMRDAGVRVILTVPYFDPRHAEFVAAETWAHIAAMAHMPGALPGTDGYLDWVGTNVDHLAAALSLPVERK